MADERAIVHVQWEDSVFYSIGWAPVDEYLSKPFATGTETAGFLIRDDDAGLVVALSHGTENGNVSDVVFIPRSAVRSMKKLERP